jgi:hypothetical protein
MPPCLEGQPPIERRRTDAALKASISDIPACPAHADAIYAAPAGVE